MRLQEVPPFRNCPSLFRSCDAPIGMAVGASLAQLRIRNVRIERPQITGAQYRSAEMATLHLAHNRLNHRCLFQFLGFRLDLNFQLCFQNIRHRLAPLSYLYAAEALKAWL